MLSKSGNKSIQKPFFFSPKASFKRSLFLNFDATSLDMAEKFKGKDQKKTILASKTKVCKKSIKVLYHKMIYSERIKGKNMQEI